MVSLVWRRLGSIAEVQRVVVQDGLLWGSPLPGSEQAIAKRLATFPASAHCKKLAPAEITRVYRTQALIPFHYVPPS